MRSPLRVGLVGCGRIAVEAHIPAYLARMGTYEVVGVCDPSAERAGVALDALGLARSRHYTSVEDLIGQADVDVVDICTPPHVRGPIALAAFAHRKHVLAEKPLALTPRAAAAQIAAANVAGVAFGVVHNYLFVPEIAAARKLIGSGAIGRPEVALINFLGVPDESGVASFNPRWRHEQEIGGGGILMDMLHAVYLVEAFLGSPIKRTSAWIWSRASDAPVEDIAICRFETDDAVGLVNVGWGQGPGGFDVSGSDGRLSIRYRNGGSLWFEPLESLTLTTDGLSRAVEVEHSVDDVGGVLDDFQLSVRQGRSPCAPGSAGQRILESVVAAYGSAAAGKTIEVPLVEDDPLYRGGTQGLRLIPHAAWSPVAQRNIFHSRTEPETL